MLNYKSIIMSASFPVFGSTLVVGSLAPTGLTPIFQISPNVLFCFIFIFLIRHPKNVSVISILFVSLLADFLWYRPIGLNTLAIVVGSEIVRWVINSRKHISVLEEFICITLILVLTTMFQEIVKFLTLIPSLQLNQNINYILITLLVYFLITMFIKIMFRS